MVIDMGAFLAIAFFIYFIIAIMEINIEDKLIAMSIWVLIGIYQINHWSFIEEVK